MGPSDTFYSSGLVKDHEVKLVGGIAELNWTPVKVGTFSIETADGKRGIADAFGNIAGDIKGVVTPAGTITIVDGGDVTAKVTYRFDNNSVRADGYEANKSCLLVQRCA